MNRNEEYAIGSRDYLARARRRSSEGSAEALFYAALEVRSGVEARMQEYLEAQQHVSRLSWSATAANGPILSAPE